MAAVPEAILIGEIESAETLGARYVEATLERTGRVHP
jgi:hypothetical protein